MRKILGLVLLVLTLITGCETTNGIANKNDLSNVNPTQLVETYYNSIASGDYSTAKNCLTNEISEHYQNNPDSDFTNIKKLTDLRVSDAASQKLHGSNYDEKLIKVEYNAQFKKEITSANGKQIRFVYVGKKEKDSPWKIISIGTAP